MSKKLANLLIERTNADHIHKLVKVYMVGYRDLQEYAYTNEDDVSAYIQWLFRRDVAGIFVAKSEGTIVGFVASDGNWYSKREGKVVGAIHELVVLPDYRNLGVGKSLINKALEYFKERGIDTVELWVGDENLQAINFYKKLGFTEKDRFSYWIRMTKNIEYGENIRS